MAYRIFSIPAAQGDGDEAAELNAFLRGHKVVAVAREFVQDGAASRWCFCVARAENPPTSATMKKIAGIGEKKAARYGDRFAALVSAGPAHAAQEGGDGPS